MQQSNWLEAFTPLPSATRTKPVTRSWRSTGQQRPSSRTFAISQRQTSSRYAQMDFLSSLLVSPAKTLVLQENKPVTMESEVYCSMKSSVWLGSFDLSSSCLKMLEIYSLTKTGKRSKKPSFKLPKQGTMQNGQLFQQVMWEHVIAGSASGLLPTPRTCLAMTASVNSKGKLEGNRFPNLETVIGRMLPTPTTRDWKDGSQQSCRNTPPNGLLGREIHQAQCSPLNGPPMYLAPCFVEEMMGYPIGWTDLSS